MRIVVGQSAWDEMCSELDRVAPDEGILLPLVALQSGSEPPSRERGVAAIDTLIVPRMLRVPAALQRNSSVHVSVLPRTDEKMEREVARLVSAHPRLRVAAYLHSHPFAQGHTRPSSGDYTGHMLPLRDQNAACGLRTSFSLIACRGSHGGWELPCFALDDAGQIVDLGFAEVVADAHPLINWALAPPLDPRARAMLRRFSRRVRRRGQQVRSAQLFDGYRRYVVREGSTLKEVIFVPCDFPRSVAQRFVVAEDGTTTRKEEVVL